MVDSVGFFLSVNGNKKMNLLRILNFIATHPLNGSGASFGVTDNEVHKIITSFGFHPISYEPFSRVVSPLESYGLGGNTIYVKDIVSTQRRVTDSESVCIRTANNLEL